MTAAIPIRLGFVDGDEAYIVPLSFGFEAENGEFTFYVHGAKAGRRHTLAKKSGRVCVEADVCSGFVELEQGSQTADYKSFIGYGEISHRDRRGSRKGADAFVPPLRL